MPTTLVIDSATEACSVAMFSGAELVDGAWERLGRGHAERLVPMIAALDGRGRADRIAISLGPGSFTGVRVGLAAARALALAWGAEIAGFSTFALLAAQARGQVGDVPLTVAMTGGHGEWFVQSFGDGGDRAGDLASLRPDAAALAAPHEWVVGSQAEALVALRGRGCALPLLPDARAFALLDPRHLTAATAPLYGRPPDARLPGESPR